LGKTISRIAIDFLSQNATSDCLIEPIRIFSCKTNFFRRQSCQAHWK
jgi:hypothetical protein